MFVASIMLLAAAAQGYGNETYDGAESLSLVCYGEGSQTVTQSNSGYTWNSDRHRYEPTFGTTLGSRDFHSDVQVEFYGDQGRIHLTGPLIPPIHSGGDNGWWELSNVRFSSDRITAGYRVNGLNKPKLTIDRRTGTIRIEGMTPFTGRCDVGDFSGGQRRF